MLRSHPVLPFVHTATERHIGNGRYEWPVWLFPITPDSPRQP
jgi:hypothetical protein